MRCAYYYIKHSVVSVPFFLLLCLLLLVPDECFMALQILAHDLDTLMGPCTPVRLFLRTDVIILTGKGSVMQTLTVVQLSSRGLFKSLDRKSVAMFL